MARFVCHLPNDRTDETPPSGRTDFVSIVLHEAGLSLGYAGTRNRNPRPGYGAFPGFINPFDVLSYFGGNGNALDEDGNPNPMFFSGPVASSLFGGDVPLANVGLDDFLFSQNFYHFGTCGDSTVLTGSLMNGCGVPVGTDPRLEITALDIAAHSVIGYTVVRIPVAVWLCGSAIGLLGWLKRFRAD